MPGNEQLGLQDLFVSAGDDLTISVGWPKCCCFQLKSSARTGGHAAEEIQGSHLKLLFVQNLNEYKHAMRFSQTSLRLLNLGQNGLADAFLPPPEPSERNCPNSESDRPDRTLPDTQKPLRTSEVQPNSQVGLEKIGDAEEQVGLCIFVL